MTQIFINGKFTAQAVTGVQRAARHWLLALDEQLGGAPALRCVLLCPPAGRPPALRRIEVRHVGAGLRNLHAWEQLALPLASRGRLLLSLSGSAPACKRLQVCTFHDAAVFDCPSAYTPVFRAWYSFLFRHLARVVPMMFTVSEFSRGRLALHLGVPAERIAVVPDGGDHLDAVGANDAVLGRLGVAPGRYLLAVGSDNPNKNHRRLVEAFGGAGLPADVALVLVGRRDPAVFADAPSAPGGARVVRASDVDDAALVALYRHAVGLVFPSLYEGFGLPALEAMACGCPVIASNAAALPEVCADAALYVDPQSLPALRGAMRRLFDEPSLRESLRMAGRRRAAQLTWGGAATRMLSRLQSLGALGGAR